MAGLLKRNAPSGAPIRPAGHFQRVPNPEGMNAQEASTVYDTFYGSMPIPATAYATSSTELRSLNDQPSVRTVASNASVVKRADRRDGTVSTGGYQGRQAVTPQVMDPPDSSKFQSYLIGPQDNWVQNRKWYIAYPAATVMNGGRHNLALSTRVDQVTTRITGGPTASSMRPAPRFKAVQTVPRYSTMPPTYPTSPSKG